MHPTVMDFAKRTLTTLHVKDKRVLEVGSYDVNGTVRPFVESLKPAQYLGVDMQPGPNVDLVVDCEQLSKDVGSQWDLVISTEMLEHVGDWRKCVCELVNSVAPHGYLLITTRSPGFPYHPFPVDNWRYTRRQMWKIMSWLGMFVAVLEDDPEPGVFVFAQKTCGKPVTPKLLAEIDIEKTVCPS
jgi:Methyltransferase domain